MVSRNALIVVLLVLCCSLSQAQTCQSINGTEACGYLQPFDCSDRWSFSLTSESDGVALVAWYGSFSSNVQAAESCTTMDDCSLCLEFDDVEYTGETVSADISMESTCDGDTVDVGFVEGDNLACCDPNYQHLPLEFDVDDISIFDFMDEVDLDGYGYEYNRDVANPLALLHARVRMDSALKQIERNARNRDARDPPDFGVTYDEGCFFMLGVPMSCSVPSLSVCADEPVAQMFTYLGFMIEFGDLEDTQEECVSINGLDLCLVIENVEVTSDSVSYTTYMSLLNMDVSGPVPLTFNFPDCSCGDESSDDVSSGEASSGAISSGDAVSSGASPDSSNPDSSVVDGNGDGDGDDGDNNGGDGNDGDDPDGDGDGDEDSGINTWAWMWSIVVGAVLLCCCVTVGIVAALVIGGVLVIKKTSTTTSPDGDVDYNLDEYA